MLAASDAEFLTELNAASAGAIGELTACSKRVGFPLQALHALRYTAPRVALLGDAAHTVHPLAGQGMNLGLLDAAAIAAVIEDALLAGEDVGDLKVLRRYERERKGDNLAMLAVFDGLNRLFGLPACRCTVALFGAARRRSDTSCQTVADAARRWVSRPGARTGCAGHARSRKHRIGRYEQH